MNGETVTVYNGQVWDVDGPHNSRGDLNLIPSGRMSAEVKAKADAFDLFLAIIPATVTDRWGPHVTGAREVIQGKILAVIKALPSIRSDQVLFVELKATKVRKFKQVIVYTKRFSSVKIGLAPKKSLSIKYVYCERGIPGRAHSACGVLVVRGSRHGVWPCAAAVKTQNPCADSMRRRVPAVSSARHAPVPTRARVPACPRHPRG